MILLLPPLIAHRAPFLIQAATSTKHVLTGYPPQKSGNVVVVSEDFQPPEKWRNGGEGNQGEGRGARRGGAPMGMGRTGSTLARVIAALSLAAMVWSGAEAAVTVTNLEREVSEDAWGVRTPKNDDQPERSEPRLRTSTTRGGPGLTADAIFFLALPSRFSPFFAVLAGRPHGGQRRCCQRHHHKERQRRL